ncbi:MAG: YraN family protein [Synechococcales bacterium]|nr:YraN family protein [Synechococcales bacterium]
MAWFLIPPIPGMSHTPPNPKLPILADQPPQPAKAVPLDPGILGEQFLVEWVIAKGGQILTRRWHCTYGELDLVALNRDRTLIFIEVKTRQWRNLDADGALAITRKKQEKLWKAAQLFLLKHPQYQLLPCRFDVALVLYSPGDPPAQHPRTPHLSRFTRRIAGYTFTLANYLLSAIERS